MICCLITAHITWVMEMGHQSHSPVHFIFSSTSSYSSSSSSISSYDIVIFTNTKMHCACTWPVCGFSLIHIQCVNECFGVGFCLNIHTTFNAFVLHRTSAFISQVAPYLFGFSCCALLLATRLLPAEVLTALHYTQF